MARKAQSAQAITLAVTGASGAPYALRLLECLLRADRHVNLLLSRAALVVLEMEAGLKLPEDSTMIKQYMLEHYDLERAQLSVYGREQWTAPVASGSANVAAMVVCPCSMGTLSAIASGASNNLIERAADVTIKERRPLILVPRESPYSAIHLENMLRLSNMGVCILPASPGFYRQPKSVQDLVDFMVARVLTHLGIDQTLLKPWGENVEGYE